MTRNRIKALVFDTYGTVVDWRSSIMAEVAALAGARDVTVDAEAFALAWRAGYKPKMDQIRRGARPWADNDVLQRERLDEILPDFGLDSLSEAERAAFSLVWHRLAPWPDSVAGLTRLKRKYVLAPLSNGSFACLTNMAKHAGLPWDAILSVDLCRHFKPDPETYRMAYGLLGLAPGEVMLVAAHNYDLRSARAEGLGTAFFARPTEYGAAQREDLEAEEDWDIVVPSLEALADQLERDDSKPTLQI